jgi:capsular polysaccharide transport system permease protein
VAQTTERVQDTTLLHASETTNPAAIRPGHGKSTLQLGQPVTYEAIAITSGGRNGTIAKGSFLAVVVAPFIAACIYYLGVATPQFIAEARFAVRMLGGPDVGGLNSGLLVTTPLPQDAYVVTSFIHSPAILGRLEERIDFGKVFAQERFDFWSRLRSDHTREELIDYWNEHVVTYLDGPSGIVTLKIRAFSPEDARMLAQAVIDESEKLANELSVRARADYIKRAEQEVGERQIGYREALSRLNELQNETAILDPRLRATETGTLLTGLLAQKLEIDARLFVLEQQAANDSPTVRQLRRAQDALQGQIEDLRSQLADDGTANENLSAAFRRFAELETNRVLASELYGAARRNLARAQVDALRKAIYVTVFVPPALADEPRHPRRIAMPLLILLGLSVAWGIGALVWASVNDHRT